MRLIDAESPKLLGSLKFIREAEYQIYGSGSWGFTAKCEHAIEDAPTIQPEIVRCGECEYCVHHPATPNTKRPCDPPQPEMWHCGKNREFKPRVMPHDFCSRGEKREVTT